MTAAIPSTCVGPAYAGNSDGARWYRPCVGKILVGLADGGGGTKGGTITAFGETVRWWTNSAEIDTVCVNGTNYLSHFRRSGTRIVGAAIDIWRAHSDGLWSSSTVVTMLGNNSSAYGDTGATAYGLSGLNQFGTISARKAGVLSVDCATQATLSWTLTVYDDGTFTFA